MRLGVRPGEPETDRDALGDHVRDAERFEAPEVGVIRAPVRFPHGRTVMAGDPLSAPRTVVATGSRPAIPPVPGPDRVPILTNETLSGPGALPGHLLALGAGAIGHGMARAFRRLGSAVTPIDAAPPPAREHEDTASRAAAPGGRCAHDRGGGGPRRPGRRAVGLAPAGGRSASGTHLLVATGRRADIGPLGLEAAGIRHGADGIAVDARRQTGERGISAIGDCRAGPRHTRVAGHEGWLGALQVATGRPWRVDWRALPRVTYLGPEPAQLGLTEREARDRHGSVEVIRQEFADTDRAVVEGDRTGFLKLVRHRGAVVGITIVGAHAGELLLPGAQAISGRASAFRLGAAVVAHATRSGMSQAAALAARQPAVPGRWPRRRARLLAGLRR